MNFLWDEDERQFSDALARLLSDRYGFARRLALAAGAGHDPQGWRALAELGLTRLCLPAWAGGLEPGTSFLLAAAPLLGRALSLEPWLSSAVQASAALARAPQAPPFIALLDAMAAGEAIVGFADLEPDGVTFGLSPLTVAHGADGAWVLHGHKLHVQHGGRGTHIVVSACVAATGATGLFLVDIDAVGLVRRDYRLVDDTPASAFVLDGAPAVLVVADAPGARCSWRDRVQLLGLATACAELSGTLALANKQTLDYVRTRRQFGRLLADNQAVRHRVAEMQMQLQSVHSMVVVAAVAAQDLATEQARSDLLRAWLVVLQGGRALCNSAIHLHGAMGMTEDLAVGHCLRRLLCHEQRFGDAALCSEALADSLSVADPAAMPPHEQHVIA